MVRLPPSSVAKSLKDGECTFLGKGNVLEHLRTVFVQRSVNGPGRSIGEPLYLVDFIPLNFNPRKIDRQKLRDLYLKRMLSTSQISDQVGLSKQAILMRLRQEGVRQRTRGRDPENFRYPYAPYGYHVADGRLVLHRKEMQAVRLIVELRDRIKTDWGEIVDTLNDRGFRSRTGLLWNRIRVKRVHKHWSGKL